MRKNFGAKHLILPQPVYILGTYNEDGTPNAMNAGRPPSGNIAPLLFRKAAARYPYCSSLFCGDALRYGVPSIAYLGRDCKKLPLKRGQVL